MIKSLEQRKDFTRLSLRGPRGKSCNVHEANGHFWIRFCKCCLFDRQLYLVRNAGGLLFVFAAVSCRWNNLSGERIRCRIVQEALNSGLLSVNPRWCRLLERIGALAIILVRQHASLDGFGKDGRDNGSSLLDFLHYHFLAFLHLAIIAPYHEGPKHEYPQYERQEEPWTIRNILIFHLIRRIDTKVVVAAEVEEKAVTMAT